METKTTLTTTDAANALKDKLIEIHNTKSTIRWLTNTLIEGDCNTEIVLEKHAEAIKKLASLKAQARMILEAMLEY